ncbi:unnamed protein product [Oikopleura dioica]|uniref:Ionotropic glutamate receptor C-terminal domain-containing protein n=1 Tax=Oikopleura dioica TaxID=34765 RepID=E4XGY6_OIKDI|nr:unnamed protein product [Oikopleura dioica]
MSNEYVNFHLYEPEQLNDGRNPFHDLTALCKLLEKPLHGILFLSRTESRTNLRGGNRIVRCRSSKLRASASYSFSLQLHQIFCVDILDVMARQLNFKYRIRLCSDNEYGNEQADGTWVNKKDVEPPTGQADLAIGSLTISYEREQRVSFTTPFMNTGVSILYKTAKPSDPGPFSFLAPLSSSVWISILVALFLVTVAVFVVTKTAVDEAKLGCCDSVWFTIGALLQVSTRIAIENYSFKQGPDTTFTTPASRTITAIWWFFTLVFGMFYTANLAAFLTVKRMDVPIKGAEDLTQQSAIAYGTMDDGSTSSFFRNSKIPLYPKGFPKSKHFNSGEVSGKPTVYQQIQETGIQRVLDGNYAFLMEASSIEYLTILNCNLTQVGGLLDSKGYGIATPKGSKWRQILSMQILKMHENGIMEELRQKWWKGNQKPCPVLQENKSSLGMESFGGIYIILCLGVVAALVVALCQYVRKSNRLQA